MSSVPRFSFSTGARAATLAALLVVAAAAQPGSALAQDAAYATGQPIVTGFGGIVEPDAPSEGSDPLDYTFIDPDGRSMVVLALEPDGPPTGQVIASSDVLAVSAADVGQVFGVTLDNAPEFTGAPAPNIYLSATSMFGLHVTVPDADGNPMRSRTGHPDASFMAGQWGSAGGATGYPGSIWKVDGETGEASLFTTIAANSGAGLGDLVYDPASAQFFVSDLDTGLIYRLAADGIILDTFDHGVDGRPEHELDPVADDGSVMNITDAAFNSEDPTTWGFTQVERKVYGLAVNGGRLYYAVAEGPQVWSVRINDDGSFGTARWELDVADLVSGNEVTDILFDPQGRMILAQRGPQVASYDYSVFAEPGTSSVVRYTREFPDDPATPGTWTPEPEGYAIGHGTDGANASGGIALGPRYDEDTNAFDGVCDAWLWSSGDALRVSPDLDAPLDPPFQVMGLQGNEHTLVRPDNEPPAQSFFVDHDGNTEDEEEAKAGHVGGIAIWQECTFDAETYVPPVLPPEDYEPEHWGDEDEDEEDEAFANLTLEKWASPYFCLDGGATWNCHFTIRVENTGDVPYWGPVVVDDYLPDNNPGATMHFWPQPPWHCNLTGPAQYQCVRGPVLLYPGDGVVLHEVVTLPKAMVGYCELDNVAGLNWFWSSDDDPTDDFDIGVAGINAPGCVPPPGGGTDLSLNKASLPNCIDTGVDWTCAYAVSVQNTGPNNFTGPITVTDTLGVNAPATVFGPWACGQVGPVLTCNILAPPVNVPPGWTSGFVVTQKIPKPAAPVCDLDNKAQISAPAGGTPSNFNAGNDFDQVSTHIPEPACVGVLPSDIQMQKTGLGCAPFFGGYACEWQLTITNLGPGVYIGPLSMVDTSAGALHNTLPTLSPACTGSPVQVTCDIPLVGLNPGVPHTVNFHTIYDGGPTACSATNNISLLVPNPGSPQNAAGNDSASTGLALPNPACAVPGLPKLNIQKTATGCYDDPASEFWLCDFDIAVLNYGTGPQLGPITVLDINDKPTTFTGAACAPLGPPGVYSCSLPGPLNAGDTWSFQAQTQVDPNGVTLADCNVIDTVGITNPPSGGDPGYIAQATQKVPQLFINVGPGPVMVYCDPPSLELSKNHVRTVRSGDGYDATFTVRATSTGPDPYNGTVEVDEDLPDGTSFVSSENWSCVPTIGNDMHCSSTYKHMPVGTYTQMTITIHIPEDVALAAQCNVVNTVNAAISAEVLHSDEGVQYTASAAAEIPARLCGGEPEPEEEEEEPAAQCPVNRVMPGGGCCEAGLVWNGRQCAAPPPRCPADSHVENGECVCDEGTEGTPGKCEPIQTRPICPDDSRLVRGECQCLPGTEGRPGRCEPIEDEEEEVPLCPKDSRLVRGECVCLPGTEGRPGRCRPIEQEEEVPLCPDDSRLVRGECVCLPGTEGRPGRCRPEVVIPICPPDSHFELRAGRCVCDAPLEGRPGNCRKPEPEVTEPTVPSCPRDSRFDTRRQTCVCNPPLVGEPGQCRRPTLDVPLDRPILRLPTIR